MIRGVNRKINHVNEWSLQVVYKDNISFFEDLLEKDKLFTIHQENIQSLAIELFKSEEILSNNIMYAIFQTRKINYKINLKINLRSQTEFASNCVNTKTFDLNSLRYSASEVWNMIPLEIKNSDSVEILKRKNRN